MKKLIFYISLFGLAVCMAPCLAQDQQAEIDSLVNKLKGAHREWNDYANPLIKIGEPAVPALVKVVRDRSLSQWARRIAAMTLNTIHSPLWVEPALAMLLDPSEDPLLRNHCTAGLNGFDLSYAKNEIWALYQDKENKLPKSNLATLLLTSDTVMALQAFKELFEEEEGYGQRYALQSLVKLQPGKATQWYLKGICLDDWMTGNFAMDSLVTITDFSPELLINIFNDNRTTEKTKWRIMYVFGHRETEHSQEMLLIGLQSDSWLIRNEAAVGLTRYFNPEITKKLKQLAKHESGLIRKDVSWVLQHQNK